MDDGGGNDPWLSCMRRTGFRGVHDEIDGFFESRDFNRNTPGVLRVKSFIDTRAIDVRRSLIVALPERTFT